MKAIYLICAVLLTVLIATSIPCFDFSSNTWEIEVNSSLYLHADFKGHPWYIAPMQGKTVELCNGSTYYVNSDYWDSCEHNPQQGHLIGIGYVNKTACGERVRLDKNPATRNFTATRALIVWANASLVVRVLP